MTTPCRQCTSHQTNPQSGAYSFACLACCTRLVLKTHPSKSHAAAMLAAIERFRGNPGRERVLDAVRLSLTKPG